tara:strand:- start:924 stop:1448 length:525 start_codon:yes stop_codon:yes gene_type:complete
LTCYAAPICRNLTTPLDSHPGNPLSFINNKYISVPQTHREFWGFGNFINLWVEDVAYGNKKLAYTPEEAANAIGVSAKTITRMVAREELPRLKGIRYIRIPVDALEQWVKDQTYTPTCVGSAMRNPQGERKCISARREKVSGKEVTVSTGGCPTRTQAVSELRSLLALPTSERR